MDANLKDIQATCKTEVETFSQYREKLSDILENIIETSNDSQCFTHIDYEPIPYEGYVIDIINLLREVLFPGYFAREKIDPINLKYKIGQSVSVLFDMLSEQIAHSIRHECFRHDLPCSECEEQGQRISLSLLESIPSIRKKLATDILAMYDGDPAAKSYDEIIFSYPGIFAMSVHRVANKLFELQVPLLPRIMSEHAHSLTGIDIHPGAKIG